MSDASSTQPTELALAGWGERFVAWLIDFIIVNVILGAIFVAVAFPFWISGSPNGWPGAGEGISWGLTSLVFLGYWMYFETTTGQSLGKMAMKIKTTDLAGSKIDWKNAAIESFGKSFLLPIDVILGWIFTNDKRQRVFARAGNTIVIKLKSGDQNYRYTKA